MRTRTPVWLWLVPLLSCGFLAPFAPFAVALKLRTRSVWAWCGSFAALWLVGLVLTGTDADSATSDLGVALFLLSAVGGTTYALVKAQEVTWGGGGQVPPGPPAYAVTPHPHDQNAAAIASVQAARQKREQAREIAARDPQMARDLRIGRPDVPRHFDDGGLVDLNSAPPVVLVRGLGLTEQQAAQVVDARQRVGRFQAPEEVMHLAGLEIDVYERVRERIVLL